MNLEHLTYEDIRYLFSITNPMNAVQLDQNINMSLVDAINVEMRKICEKASKLGCRIIMDAEQSYFQPAIDDIILGFCSDFNCKPNGAKDGNMAPNWSSPMIYNSYQSYLISTSDKLKKNISFSQKMNYSVGVKLVRGAYMVQEEQLAKVEIINLLFMILCKIHMMLIIRICSTC